jgi:hypothetical protein
MLREDQLFIDVMATCQALAARIEELVDALQADMASATVGYSHDIDPSVRTAQPIFINSLLEHVSSAREESEFRNLLFHEGILPGPAASFDGNLVVAYTVLASHVALEFEPATAYIVMRDTDWDLRGAGTEFMRWAGALVGEPRGDTLNTYTQFIFLNLTTPEYADEGITFESLNINQSEIYQPTENARHDVRVFEFIREAAMYEQRVRLPARQVDIQRDYFPNHLFDRVEEYESLTAQAETETGEETGEEASRAIAGMSEADQLRLTLMASIRRLGTTLDGYTGESTSPTNTFMYALAAGAVLLFWEAIVGT